MEINVSKVGIKKSKKIRSLILEGLEIIEAVGVPLNDLTPRRLEKISMCFLALCEMNTSKKWNESKSISNDYTLRSRDIINYINKYFEEDISSGSYDDIRRKDLIRLTGMGLVIKSANNLNSDTNDGTRGNAIEESFSKLIKSFKSSNWDQNLASFKIDENYLEKFYVIREKQKLEVKLEKGLSISLDDGPHNVIQKAIIEEFLPIYGYNAKVLYIGDTSEKHIHEYSKIMMDLGLNIEDRGMLPDVVAFSESKKWVYLIEAVHSSNPLNSERCIELQRTILKDCSYGVVFVTAFLNKKEFAKWLPQIAWETEVWLVDTPEHLIHFNGDKFLGPHSKSPTLS